ncbi:MAG: peptide-methionine (S)-S-oxide reductase, partial [Solobacterium sp.]|nr:peptide-methionine (S)-S-oxide reductase [Solobacterium sp.]
MIKTIYLAGGCFWGVQHYFDQFDGILNTTVGYANGKTQNPKYKDVKAGLTGHAETLEIQYDDNVISLSKILDLYFDIIDPVSVNQQGEDDCSINSSIEAEIFSEIKKLEEYTGKKFGDLENPLLVSVRSGARVSMPGMMDTVLNLGLNDEVVKAFSEKTSNGRFVYDSYRRFIQMFSDVVMW